VPPVQLSRMGWQATTPVGVLMVSWANALAAKAMTVANVRTDFILDVEGGKNVEKFS
jgi:hypothetical protein